MAFAKCFAAIRHTQINSVRGTPAMRPDRSSVGATMPASLSAAADGGLPWGRSITSRFPTDLLVIPPTGRRPTAAMIVIAIYDLVPALRLGRA